MHEIKLHLFKLMYAMRSLERKYEHISEQDNV